MDERDNIYLIPDNFIDESRVLNGMFRTRNFIEGLLFGGLIAFIASIFVQGLPLNIKIMIVVGLALPVFLGCVIGVGGDPITVFIKHVLDYKKNKKVMLYNDHISLDYQKSELEKSNEPTPRDKLMAKFRKMSQKKAEEAEAEELVEGENFVFVEDSLAEKMNAATGKGKKAKVAKRSAGRDSASGEGGFVFFIESDDNTEDGLDVYSAIEEVEMEEQPLDDDDMYNFDLIE